MAVSMVCVNVREARPARVHVSPVQGEDAPEGTAVMRRHGGRQSPFAPGWLTRPGEENNVD